MTSVRKIATSSLWRLADEVIADQPTSAGSVASSSNARSRPIAASTSSPHPADRCATRPTRMRRESRPAEIAGRLVERRGPAEAASRADQDGYG